MSGSTRIFGFRPVGRSFAAALCLLLATGVAAAGVGAITYTPGAAGAGDPYFPTDGNGGYDVSHYLLDVRYDPATDVLEGRATIRARALQNLSRFNLDFEGLTVESVKVGGAHAAWSRDGGELMITPPGGIRFLRQFVVEIEYEGVPETLVDLFGVSGFIHTDDGALVVGQPHVADTWYPVNDHPSDKASYTFRITAPAGLEAVANGTLHSTQTSGGWTTWVWDAREPMASYLAMAAIGEFELRQYEHRDLWFLDAVDPDLYAPTGSPRTGAKFAISQAGEPSYKRLMRTIAVPAGGATMTFWLKHDTEPGWDFVFVEAHSVGADDWRTLPDLNGHTNQETGFSCPGWHELHPFLEHYQSDEDGDGSCTPSGSSGAWHAASGESGGYVQWRVDLSAFAGKTAEVSISYVSDQTFQLSGAFVDDIVVSTGAGTTSFEDDADPMDGWTVPGEPPDSPPNPNDWIVGTAAETPPPLGGTIDMALGLQPEIIDWQESLFGDYPFGAAGGIVDDTSAIGFALETQTRSIYSKFFFGDPGLAVDVTVHELAHQWFGDSLTIAQWKHIWLNEGFATYAEWLWHEHKGDAAAQETFDFFYGAIPEDDFFWQVVIGDPGPELLFHGAVYIRGAMTLHQLRVEVGDRDFFRILNWWARFREGQLVTTNQFILFAELISGEQLDDLFDTWLFTPGKPGALATAVAASTAARAADVDGRGSSLTELRLKLRR